jgi:predicted amidophosphoribosyltransferase
MHERRPGLVIKLGVKSCPECKGEVHKDANICPHCRTQLSEHPKWIEMKQQGGSCLILLGALIIAPGAVGAAVLFLT